MPTNYKIETGTEAQHELYKFGELKLGDMFAPDAPDIGAQSRPYLVKIKMNYDVALDLYTGVTCIMSQDAKVHKFVGKITFKSTDFEPNLQIR